MLHSDICIAGAGVIGLSLALELQARNLSVTVVEVAQPLGEASWAAAGMLAAQDPHNPKELSALAELSASLYPRFLDRLQSLSGIPVPFQTFHTLQALRSGAAVSMAIETGQKRSLLFEPIEADAPIPPGFSLLEERSVDPRQLAASLLAAATAAHIRVCTDSPLMATCPSSGPVQIVTAKETFEAAHFIDCTGAWANDPEYSVFPVKGQMLAVMLPSCLPLKVAVRTEALYIVPRTVGAMAGRAIVGATVENVGFDRTLHASQIEGLRQQAIGLLPELSHAEVLDSWCGFRPATADLLPILGAHPARLNHWVASGHYRNGILLAPGTAQLMARLLLGETPTIPFDSFAPSRFHRMQH